MSETLNSVNLEHGLNGAYLSITYAARRDVGLSREKIIYSTRSAADCKSLRSAVFYVILPCVESAYDEKTCRQRCRAAYKGGHI